MTEQKNRLIEVPTFMVGAEPSRLRFQSQGFVPRKLSPRVQKLIDERDGYLPVWVESLKYYFVGRGVNIGFCK